MASSRWSKYHDGLVPIAEGLSIPSGDACWIEVGGERRTWRNGELLLMDTTFSHRTANDAEEDRSDIDLNRAECSHLADFALPGALSD
jgi:hypothetical protein